MAKVNRKKTAIIIGAGPAGLTAAYELLQKTNITPVIYEESGEIGGLSKTIKYKGNGLDIGGHRFFSKSDRIMEWWQKILPIESVQLNPEKNDKVILIRSRLSRIFFLKKFFDYPVKLNLNTILNLGLGKMLLIIISYTKAKLLPIMPEKTLEDFFINRFGKKLFLIFFKDYTEKLWGVPCREIKAEWGVQRVKGLSITSVLAHMLKNVITKTSSISQKNTETSLIKSFLYPKFGPGQMWKEVAKIIEKQGGKIFLRRKVVCINVEKNKVKTVKIKNKTTGKFEIKKADYFFSSMPIKNLISGFSPKPPKKVLRTAKGLVYRDFITVGLLVKKIKLQNNTKIKTVNNIIPDNWIYIQEKNVKLGRLQLFNNWSPYMVKNLQNIWLGLEYFCSEGDELWNKSKKEFLSFTIDELVKINIIEKEDVLDGVVIKVAKAYPAYFGAYDDFPIIKNFTDKFSNLFLIGRNGMHRYNNQDHSMLSAMTAVENIINNSDSKYNIWNINTEREYNESK